MRSRINFGNHSVFSKIEQSTLLRTDHGTLKKKSVVWKRSYKIIYQGVQENIAMLAILNVAIFCVQTKVFGDIKFCCPIITLFVS